MKSILTLSLAAVSFIFCAYLLCAGNGNPTAEAGNGRYITDLIATERAAAPAKAPAVVQAPKHTTLMALPGPNPMREALATNDVCAVENIKRGQLLATREDIRAVAETSDTSSALSEFLADDGPLLSQTANVNNYSSRGSRMLWALRLGGIVKGNVPVRQNATQARLLLLALEKDFPANGALPLFRLGLEKKLRFGTQELLRTAEKVAASTEFETYLDDIAAETHRLKWQSPAHHRLLEETESFFTLVPDLSGETAVINSLRPYLYAETVKKIGRLIMAKAEHSRAPSSSREYSLDQYVAGASLAGDKNPMNTLVKLSEAKDRDLGITYPAFPDLGKRGDCDSRAYEEFFFSHRGAN